MARACERNYVPNSWGVLKYLGLANRNRVIVAEDPNVSPADLAYAIRTSEAEIEMRRYAPLGQEHVSFFGLDVHRSAIETRIRRFSPASLRKHPVHRALWELRDLPFCPFGWDMLQEVCPCEGVEGVVQGWTRTLSPVDCCDRCGDPLHRLEAVPVPAHLRDGLSLMLTLTGTSEAERDLGRSLPVPMAGADRSSLFDLISRLTRALVEDRGLDRSDVVAFEERCEAMDAACRAVIDWPVGIHELRPRADVSEASWGRLLAAYLSCGSGSAQAVSHRNAHLARQPEDDGASTLELLGLRPASEIANVRDDVLFDFWNEGEFTQHRRAHGGRMLPAIERNELDAFARRWHGRIELDAFAGQLGVTHNGVEQLLALGLARATAPALNLRSPNLLASEAADFLVRVASNAAPAVEDPVSLRQASYAIGGRLKPWGPIFAAMLSGEVGYVVAEDGMTLVDRISIAAGDVDRIRDLEFRLVDHPDFHFAERVVQNDALAMLNASRKTSQAVQGLPSEGTNPKTYAMDDVLKRAAEIITLPEIAFAMGLNPSAACHRLRRVGLKATMYGNYPRELVEPFIAEIAKIGSPTWKGRSPAEAFKRVLMKRSMRLTGL